MAKPKVSKKKTPKMTDPDWRRKTWDDFGFNDSTIQGIDINALILDDTVQTRAVIDEEAVSQFARDIAAGDQVPNLKVVSIPDPEHPKEPSKMYVVDGFSRFNAYYFLAHDYIHKYLPEGKEIYDYQRISCQILNLPEGMIEDVRRIAIGLNRKNGQSRKVEDLKREIWLALADPILKRMSSSELGRRIGCSHQTIEKYRKQFAAKKRTASGIEITDEEIAEIEIDEDDEEEDVRVGKDGREFKAAKTETPSEATDEEEEDDDEWDEFPDDEEAPLDVPSGNGYRKRSEDREEDEAEAEASSGNDYRKDEQNFIYAGHISFSAGRILETGNANNPATYAKPVRDVLVTLSEFILRKNVKTPTSEEISATAGIILEGVRMLLYKEAEEF